MIRYYQASQLKENHNMMNVMVYREKLSKSFENQVIATYDTFKGQRNS